MKKTPQLRQLLMPALLLMAGLLLAFIGIWQYQLLSKLRVHVKNSLELQLTDIAQEAGAQLSASLEKELKSEVQTAINLLQQSAQVTTEKLEEIRLSLAEGRYYYLMAFVVAVDSNTNELEVWGEPGYRQKEWKSHTPDGNFLQNRLRANQDKLFDSRTTFWANRPDSLLVLESLSVYQNERFACYPIFVKNKITSMLCIRIDGQAVEHHFVFNFFKLNFQIPAKYGELMDEKYLQFGLRNQMKQLVYHSVALGTPRFEKNVPLEAFGPLLSPYSLGIGFRNTSSAAIANAVFRRNIWLWAGLGILWLVLALFLIRAIWQSEKLVRLKSAFVANVSHEFKTPLTSIRMAHETLAQGRFHTPEEVQKIATHIGSETQRLEALVYRLLDFGQMESGRSQWRMESISLDSCMENLLLLAQQKTAEKGFLLKTTFLPAAASLYADATALEQVVLILLDNAIKYASSQPQVELNASVTGGNFQLDIRDYGPGISRADQKQIFDRFTRLGDHDRHDVKGFGLGLAIAAEIARAHKGKLSYVSPKDGKGSIFRLELPLENKS